MAIAETFLWATLGGILPAIIWLLFWLREDTSNPEPRKLIIATFLAGMAATLVSLLAENTVAKFVSVSTTLSVVIWAIIEEVSKFAAAYFVALRSKDNNEPVDAMVYLVTAALGFAALENAFFLLGPLVDGNIVDSLITGNLRFVGSSLLHVIASGAIGIFAAYAFCELKVRKTLIVGTGLVLAIILHAFFNFFILKGDNNLFTVFGFVWVGVVLLIMFFERVKRIDRTCVISS